MELDLGRLTPSLSLDCFACKLTAWMMGIKASLFVIALEF